MTEQSLEAFRNKVIHLHEQVVGLLGEVQNVTKVVTIDDVYKELKNAKNQMNMKMPQDYVDPIDEETFAILFLLMCIVIVCIVYVGIYSSPIFRKPQCHCGLRVL